MSYLLIILFYTTIIITAAGKNKSCDENESVHGLGTVLFTAADLHKQCWSQEDIAILSTRMILEDLLPDVSVLNIDCNDFVEDIVSYFRLLIEVVKKATQGRKKRITLLALTDLLGAYLQFAVLPVARYSFYAGVIDYTRIEKLIQLYEEIKWFLRTNGQGWPKPMQLTSSIIIEPINFEIEKPNVNSCCDQLIFFETERRSSDDEDTGIVIRSHIIFPLPFFDSTVRPSSIAVPFKRYPLRNIESRKVSYILMKFFIGAVQCLKEKKTEKETQQRYLNSFYGWVRKEVIPKLDDDKFYSAFGGILRVDETLRNLGAIEFTNITCPEGEQELVVPGMGGNNKHSSPSLLLIIMLIIIIAWFIIGTGFICYRMKKHRKKTDGQDHKPKPDVSSGTTGRSKWSLFSRSKSEAKSDQESTGKCKCSTKTTPYSSSYTSDYDTEEKIKKRKQKKDKSVTICYPPFMVPFIDKNKPAVIETKTTMKKLPSIEEISEITVESRRKKPEKSGYYNTAREYSKKLQQKGTLTREHIMVSCEDFNTTGSGSTSHSKFCKKKQSSGEMNGIDECWCDILKEDQKYELNDSFTVDQGGEEDETRDVDIRRSRTANRKKQQITDKGTNVGKQHRTSSLEVSFKNGDIEEAANSEEREIVNTLPLTGEEEQSPENSPKEDTTADELSGVTDKEISPHAYACHSSLTGAYANRNTDGKPHIFGYDFQTSSSSEFTEEETDLKTSTSK